MPTPQLSKIARAEGVPVSEVESFWNETKAKLEKSHSENSPGFYAILQSIMKKKYKKWADSLVIESAQGYFTEED